MIGRKRLVGFLSIAIACSGIAACQQNGSRPADAAPAGATADQTPAASAIKPTESVGGPVDSPGKTLAPIDFDYVIIGTPAVGQPLEIRINTRVRSARADLNLALSGDERLQIPAEMARQRLAAAAGGEPITRTLRVTPTAPGTLYLNALVQADIDGRLQSRSVTIPIRVGGGAPSRVPAGTVSTDASGEPIISLPAREN